MLDQFTPSGLLAIPREVRNLVYEEFVWTCHESAARPGQLRGFSPPLLSNLTATSTRPSQIAAILGTSRQVRHEFLEELYRVVQDKHVAVVSDEMDPKEPYWTTTSLGYCLELALRLRTFSLEIHCADRQGRTKSGSLHRNLENSIDNIIFSLPSLEHLDLVLSLGSDAQFSSGHVPSSKRLCSPTRLLNYLPGESRRGAEQAASAAGSCLGGARPAHSRLKTFKKTLAIRFACVGEFPLEMMSLAHSFNSATGSVVSSRYDSRKGGFVNEWSMVELDEIKDFVDVIMGEGFWQSTFQYLPEPLRLENLYDMWMLSGKMTRERCQEMKSEREDARRATLKAIDDQQQVPSIPPPSPLTLN